MLQCHNTIFEKKNLAMILAAISFYGILIWTVPVQNKKNVLKPRKKGIYITLNGSV